MNERLIQHVQQGAVKQLLDNARKIREVLDKSSAAGAAREARQTPEGTHAHQSSGATYGGDPR